MPDCSWRVAIVLLTYLKSPLLAAALRTWIPDATWMGFDTLLMVSSPPGEVANFTQRALPAHVSIRNAYSLLINEDSRRLERWKVHAFYSMLLDPSAHDWYVMLDTDTIPNMSLLARFLCALALRQRPLDRGSGVYAGFRPKDEHGMHQLFATGQFYTMDSAAIRTLQGLMVQLRRVDDRRQCHSNKTLASKPPYWAGCCAVNDGLVTSFDVFIGTCLSKTNVSLLQLGPTWWDRLFRHSYATKQANVLLRTYPAWRERAVAPPQLA